MAFNAVFVQMSGYSSVSEISACPIVLFSGTAQVEQFGDNAGEARLRWLGCAQRRCSGYIQLVELSGGGKEEVHSRGLRI